MPISFAAIRGAEDATSIGSGKTSPTISATIRAVGGNINADIRYLL
jgi:hypothetical protein